MTEFKLIKSNSCISFAETLLNLLYKYTSCIPLNSTNFKDVSLYDHSKSSAALALCLYDIQQEKSAEKTFFLLDCNLVIS